MPLNAYHHPEPVGGAGGRPLSSLLALLLIPLLLGLLAAPWIYNFMMGLGLDPAVRKEAPELARYMRHTDIGKVAKRCVMVIALFMLVPLIRRSGLAPAIRAALRPATGDPLILLRALLLGCATMSALYLSGLAAGAHVLDPSPRTSGDLVQTILSFVAGSVFIGIFEEVFFRGFVFGAIRSRTPFWGAAFAASTFFAMVHFITPAFPGRLRFAHWYDGFTLVPYMFDGFNFERDWPFMFTLFLMGLTLCVLYAKSGRLSWCIGLHGGWVLAMQLGAEFFDREHDILGWWYGHSGYLSKAPVALPLILAFFVWSLAWQPTPGPARGTCVEAGSEGNRAEPGT